ncbi:glycerophosphodiester phosphodiesterase [Solicola gregarius]|uniref:glycerophosphodiester phosphodiesterase n=1 Tax=Solicola gregarius TaxID=2908642 RepID=A0AA46TJG2_9ACTN|nr:glycerophosphodiester phosphodiesterase [Solicola gregarius]UYM06436.1 glycerophosphodiester phosphodiesterase [Solicola gregarius]
MTILRLRSTYRFAAAVGGVALAASLVAAPAPAVDRPGEPSLANAANRFTESDEPVVIAHRGASGYRPEHTLAAYRLAIQMGADYIEPDLVNTLDGVLVARHENEISGTTDVADHPEFTDRKTTKVIDGQEVTGWFTEDFTLAELKTLRAKERLPDVRPANTRYDGRFEIPTLQEVIDLAQEESRKRGVTIGIAPETKHPSYFRSIGLRLERPLIETLRTNRLNRPNAPVVVQSFETSNLRYLARRTRVHLAQLVSPSGAPYDFVESGDPRTYADLVSGKGLRWVSRYATSIGAHTDVLIPRDENGFLGKPTRVVKRAHRNNLEVFVWTFRDENQFLPADFRVGDDPNAKGDVFGMYDAFFELGVDGVFADQPDSAIQARDWYYGD